MAVQLQTTEQHGLSGAHCLNTEEIFHLDPESHKVLTLHRSNIRKELLEAHLCEDIMKSSIKVKMINDHGNEEKGEDDGVLRDALSLFWRESYISMMLGEGERAPCIRHDMRRTHWQAVARILLHGFIQEQYFSIQLSVVFLLSILYGEESITEKMYLDSFKNYVSKAEAVIIDKIIANEILLDEDDVMEFLSAFDCEKKILTPLRSYFPTKEELQAHFVALLQTATKVCRMLDASPGNSAEAESFAHLKRWLKGLDDRKEFSELVRQQDIYMDLI
eukprot:gene13438-14821_t